ncbi:hypothetical protein [Diaphorobacter sp. JS3051]|uniref:hypothetical protein n=1 Tax=Diaphorobacter sp. JS3051 TaxID=2792224 RepID=UPI0018CB11CE|nr:hypothetical protein [Diaphorobacter sp. JS3051]QPN32793.1 hypothetical protein I3K84_09610 [Diaphorobacter sp. JS3051]
MLFFSKNQGESVANDERRCDFAATQQPQRYNSPMRYPLRTVRTAGFAPIVSSISSKDGFSPRLYRLGLFFALR